MALADPINTTYFEGDGTFSTVDCDWIIFDRDHAVVSLTDEDGATVTLTQGTDYTIPESSEDDPDGFVVTFVDNGQDWLDVDGDLDTGWTGSVTRILPLTQPSDIRNQGLVLKEAIETQFDRQVMIDQQLQLQIDRSYKIPITEDPDDFTMTVPALSERAGKVAGWDSQGNITALTSFGSGVSLSSFMEDALDSADLGAFLTAIGIDSSVQGILDDTSIAGVLATLGLTGAILRNGNTFGADMVIGTNDNFDLIIETNAVSKLGIDGTGNVYVVSGQESDLGQKDGVIADATRFRNLYLTDDVNAKGFITFYAGNSGANSITLIHYNDTAADRTFEFPAGESNDSLVVCRDVNPVIGEILYYAEDGASPNPRAVPLAPNTAATKKYLTMTGTGTEGAPPTWDDFDAAEIPAGSISFDKLNLTLVHDADHAVGAGATVDVSIQGSQTGNNIIPYIYSFSPNAGGTSTRITCTPMVDPNSGVTYVRLTETSGAGTGGTVRVKVYRIDPT